MQYSNQLPNHDQVFFILFSLITVLCLIWFGRITIPIPDYITNFGSVIYDIQKIHSYDTEYCNSNNNNVGSMENNHHNKGSYYSFYYDWLRIGKLK